MGVGRWGVKETYQGELPGRELPGGQEVGGHLHGEHRTGDLGGKSRSLKVHRVKLPAELWMGRVLRRETIIALRQRTFDGSYSI